MNKTNTPLSSIPSDILSIADYERYAKDRLPHSVYEYIAGGVADEITLKSNLTDFNAYNIIPSALNSFSGASTKTNLFDECLSFPFLLAPLAHQKLAHPEGELATATAANAMKTGMVASTLSNFSLENIAQKTQSTKWFQLYFQNSKTLTLDLVKRAERAGYSALVITIDAPINGLRYRPQRAGFTIPEHIKEANLLNPETHDTYHSPQRILESHQSIIFDGFMADAPQWEDILWLKQKTTLPIILKGILNPTDAKHAKSVGIDGIIVSNHGGRTLDTLPSSIHQLPFIRQAVGGQYPILLDSGIRRGTDIFKAIALGANSVLIGRPQIYSLAVAGALGVAHMIQLLQQELEITMALAGCPTLSSITQQQIKKV